MNQTDLKLRHPNEHGYGAYRLDCGSESDPERLGTDKPLDLRVLVGVLEPTGEIRFVPST